MPRIRSVKPQFWLDEKLGKILRDARLLYIGLWNLSDDTGVFEWRPARIKVQIFPYDTDVNEETISNWLNLLVQSGDIIQFNVNGNSFGYIPTFLKHQDIKKPSQWRFTNIPEELITTHPPVPHSLSTDIEPEENESPSSSPREKEKIKVVGYREKESKYLNLFKKYTDELKLDFPEIDIEHEMKRCATWWAESRKVLKRPKTSINNWMIKTREFKKNDDRKPHQQSPKPQNARIDK